MLPLEVRYVTPDDLPNTEQMQELLKLSLSARLDRERAIPIRIITVTNKQEQLARLKSERKALTLRVVEGIATKTEKMRLTMIRNEIRMLERRLMLEQTPKVN